MARYVLASRSTHKRYSTKPKDYDYEGTYDSYSEADDARLKKGANYDGYTFEIFSEEEWNSRYD